MQFAATPEGHDICLPGWHIPNTIAFETLSSAVGGDGPALKEIGQGTVEGAGTNTSGFSALLAGLRGQSGGYFS